MNLHQLTSEYGPFIVGGSFMAVLLWVWARIGWIWKLLTKIFVVEYQVDQNLERHLMREILASGKKVELGVFNLIKNHYNSPTHLPEPNPSSTSKYNIDERLYIEGFFLYKKYFPIWFTPLTSQNDVLKIAAQPGCFKCFRLFDPIKKMLTSLPDFEDLWESDWGARPITAKPEQYVTPAVPYEFDDYQQELFNELTMFKMSENWYKSRGLNYRRGILLFGIPGGGKSEFPKVIASKLWGKKAEEFINFAEIGPQEWFDWVKGRSSPTATFAIVVLNDLHCIFNGTELISEDKEDKITFEQFINGLSRLNNTLFFITTNDVSKIDPALGAPIPGDPLGRTTRPGRIDRAVEFKPPSFDCRYRISKVICRDHDRAVGYATKSEGWTQAQLVEEVSRVEVEQFFTKNRGPLTPPSEDEILAELLEDLAPKKE